MTNLCWGSGVGENRLKCGSVGWWIILLCWKLAWFGNRWRWYFVICDFYKFWQFDISCSRNPRPHSLNRTKPKPVASPPFAFKTCLRTFLSKRDLLREKKAVKVGQYQRITAQDCSILNGNAIHKKKIMHKFWYFLQKTCGAGGRGWEPQSNFQWKRKHWPRSFIHNKNPLKADLKFYRCLLQNTLAQSFSCNSGHLQCIISWQLEAAPGRRG